MVKKSSKKAMKVEPPPEKVPFSERTLGSFKVVAAVVDFLNLPEQETFFHGLIRTAVKRFFDFLRNLMICGLILFLGYKAKNEPLIFIGNCALYLLVLSVWTHFDPYLAKITFKTKQVRVDQIANVSLQLIFSLLISLGVGFVVVVVVAEIVVSYIR